MQIKPVASALMLIGGIGAGVAGGARSEPSNRAIELVYEPSNRELTLTVPATIYKSISDLHPPGWLKRLVPTADKTLSEHAVIFAGRLPEIDDANPNFGAGDSGAFLFDVFEWLPTSPGRSPTEIMLRTPLSHRGLLTGELISESTTDETYTAVFGITDDWQATDIFFGPYEVHERVIELSTGQVAIRTYFKPGEQGYSEGYLEAVDRYIMRYSREIGPYPYSGFSVASAPIPVGFAFDGMTYVSEQILGHPYMLGRSLAHEVLHSWWGSGVQIDYDTGNWSEGLTTYQADYALAFDRGPETAKAMRREWLAALSSLPPDDDRPLRGFKSSAHSRDQSIGYGKSAMLFHMLHQSLGDDVFASALRRFWHEHQGEAADWTDLQNAFEAESGRDLVNFFNQWLDRTGLPRISLDAVEVDPAADGYNISVHLSQTGEAFIIELPVLIETLTGKKRETILLEREAEIFEITVMEQPLSVSVDPDFDVLRALAEGELPPTVRDILRSANTAVMVGEGADAAADGLVQSLFGDEEDLERVEAGMTLPGIDAVIAVGTTDEIAGLRERHLETDTPKIARQGKVRAWVERDKENRLWLFASSDFLDSLSEELSSLRYYGSQSYVMLAPDGPPVTGRWPVRSSPLQIQLN